MNIYLRIFLFLILISCHIFPQVSKEDSSQKISSINSLQKLQIKFDEFEVYRELNYMKMNVPTTRDSNTIWMWTKLALSNSGSQGFNPGSSPAEMIAPLYQQFLEDSKLNPVRYVLGMAQTAAVGYLLYRHINKYGLFR